MIRPRKQQNSFLDYGKTPPQAVDLEENIIGVLLSYPKYLNQDNLKHLLPEYFYKEHHQVILKTILFLNNNNIIVDVLSVTGELKKRGELDMVGGAYEIDRLSSISSVYNFRHNMLIVRQMYIYRDIIRISSEAIRSSFEMSKDVFDLIDETSDKVLALTPEVEREQDTKTTVNNAIQDIFLRAEGKIKAFWKTGYDSWDKYVATSPGVMVVGGAQGVGKTTFMTFILTRLLKTNKDISINWVCIDRETGASILRKFFSQSLHLTEGQLIGKEGKLSQLDLDRVIGVQDYYSNYDIEFVEQADTIKNLLKTFKSFVSNRSKESLKIFFLDNLMKTRKEGRNNEIEHVNDVALQIGDMYNTMKNDNVLFIIVHHFNKGQTDPEKAKEGYKPTVGDLKGSGTLAQVANQIILLNRPGNYDDIKKKYQYKFIESFIIADLAKNTFGKELPMYWWGHLPYTIYDEINELNN